ncbi:RNA polymerase sigma-70 factor [Sphingobacterium sp. LRF_L2]|uniref:RNA polymerase sigma-70 factor n=1 Tax=Sphingobacterium sp. LRF_L2 TaxID=3369421 RepID=UPI003F644294
MSDTNTDHEFIALYDRLSPKVYRIAFLYTQDEELAKDVLQDVFMMLWKNQHPLQGTVASIESYLFQSARNKSIDILRKSKIQLSYAESVKPFLELGSEDTERVTSFRFLQQEINEIINGLPEKCREVYQLSRRENLDNKTIAYRLNISEKTVKNHLTRALNTLRDKLRS